MKSLTVFAVCLFSIGVCGLVCDDARVMGTAEASAISGGCIDNAYANAAAGTCDTANNGFLWNCPDGAVNGWCTSCENGDTNTWGCTGTTATTKCRIVPESYTDCGCIEMGNCVGNECNDYIGCVAALGDCNDVSVKDSKPGTCPW